MIPILYDSTETAFTSNGIGRLADAVSCTVTEERNGIYELELQYPITGQYFSEITHSRILGAVPADGKRVQPFRVYRVSKPLDGICTVYAEHISYELASIPVMPFSADSCANALHGLVSHAGQACPFTVWTDKDVTVPYTVTEPRPFRELLGGAQGSILDVYGKGEYEFDQYQIRLHVNRGSDSSVTIRYGKNLVNLVKDENIEEVYTGVCPFWKDDETGNLVTLPEIGLWADTAANYPYKRTQIVDFSGEFEAAPTAAQLRARTAAYIEANDIGIPKVSVTVEFVPLSQVSGASIRVNDGFEIEPGDYAVLERVNLCDTVTVIYSALGVNVTAQVVKTVYNVLKDRYDSIEIGNARTTLASQIVSMENALQAGIENSRSYAGGVSEKLKAYVDHQTALIMGGLGGHVMLYPPNAEPQEILIMDTDSVETAVNIWRWNLNGLGHSKNGYSGPFETAWTMDGVFNASFIGAGEMDGVYIKAGTITSEQIAAGSITISNLSAAAQNVLVVSSATETQYYLSTSDASATDGAWSTSIPAWSSGRYMWTRDVTVNTYADDSTSTTYKPSEAGVYDANLTDALRTATEAATAAAVARTAADDAASAAETAQNTASGAASAAAGAQTTAENAASAASRAQTTAENAASAALQAQSSAETAADEASAAQKTASSANAKEQLIFYSAPVGTIAANAPSAWVSTNTDTQNTWTTRRPTYNRDYPVLFVATQRQTVGGTVSSSTPLIDNTTTVIDGGNIIAGTITANKIAAGAITAGNIFLYGKIGVYTDETLTTNGGYLGYMFGATAGGTTDGIAIMDNTSSNYVMATTAGVKMRNGSSLVDSELNISDGFMQFMGRGCYIQEDVYLNRLSASEAYGGTTYCNILSAQGLIKAYSGITYKNASDASLVYIGASESCGYIAAYDANGNRGAFIGANNSGIWMVGTQYARLSQSTYGGYVGIFNASGSTRATLQVSQYGGVLALYNANAALRATLTVGAYGGGLALYNTNNVYVAGLGVDEAGAGYLVLYDASGSAYYLNPTKIAKLDSL